MAGHAASPTPASRGCPAPRRRVLHLIGSREDRSYHDLSVLDARACDDCKNLDCDLYDFHYAVVHTDGSWSFPESLCEEVVGRASRMSTPAAITHIARLDPDVMVPHMVCVEGMTRFRSLFDILQIPVVGNHDCSVWLLTDKALTKNVLASAGVRVPLGEVLIKGKNERPLTVKVPFIVKPCKACKSRGTRLVRREEDATEAIDYAFGFDTKLVIEEYVAGQALRAACIEEIDGTLTVLPKIEYITEDIETSAHKIATDTGGKISADSVLEATKEGDRQRLADLAHHVHERIDDMVTRAHEALKCRHYSIFDIRIDQNGQPFFLEAQLFCSFSPVSVLPSMAAHSGREDLKHGRMFHNFLERAAAEKEGLRKDAKSQIGSSSCVWTSPTCDSLPGSLESSALCEFDDISESDSSSSEDVDSCLGTPLARGAGEAYTTKDAFDMCDELAIATFATSFANEIGARCGNGDVSAVDACPRESGVAHTREDADGNEGALSLLTSCARGLEAEQTIEGRISCEDGLLAIAIDAPRVAEFDEKETPISMDTTRQPPHDPTPSTAPHPPTQPLRLKLGGKDAPQQSFIMAAASTIKSVRDAPQRSFILATASTVKSVTSWCLSGFERKGRPTALQGRGDRRALTFGSFRCGECGEKRRSWDPKFKHPYACAMKSNGTGVYCRPCKRWIMTHEYSTEAFLDHVERVHPLIELFKRSSGEASDPGLQAPVTWARQFKQDPSQSEQLCYNAPRK